MRQGHLVPLASAALISTQSGVMGRVRPGAASGNAFTPTLIISMFASGYSAEVNGVVVTKSPLTTTERSVGRTPVSRIWTASLIASDDR